MSDYTEETTPRRSSVFDYLRRIHPNATIIDDRTEPETTMREAS